MKLPLLKAILISVLVLTLGACSAQPSDTTVGSTRRGAQTIN